MKIAIAVGTCAVLLSSCKATQISGAKAITDAAGHICEVVFQAANPAAAPLCTTAAELILAIESVIPTTDVEAGPCPTVKIVRLHLLSRPLSGPERARVYELLAEQKAYEDARR